MLGPEEPVKWTADAEGLAIHVPASVRNQPPCDHAWAFAVRGFELGQK